MIRAAAILACAPLLASCQFLVEVRVTGPPSAPIFELTETGWFGGGPPAIGGLTVTTESGEDWRIVWSVGSDGGCAATERIVYGRVPAGFTGSGPAPALEPGRVYEVSVMGCGNVGGAWFKPLADRIVYEPGISDDARRRIEAAR